MPNMPTVWYVDIVLSKKPLHPVMPSSGPVTFSKSLLLELKLEQLSNPTKSTVLWQNEPYSHFCPKSLISYNKQ